MHKEGIQEILSRTAEKFSDRTALEWRGRRVAYAELETSTNRFANYLASSGIAKGSIIAILVGDRLKLVETMIASIKAGCAFAPLEIGEPHKRLERMILGIGADLFVVEAEFYDKFASLASSMGKRVKAILVNGEEGAEYSTKEVDVLGGLATHPNFEKPALLRDPDGLCYIFFTSGSTGTPKAIAGRLKSLLHFAQWEINTFGIDQQWRVSQLAAPTFDACLRDIFVPLCAGGTVCIPEGRETVLDAPRLIRWIDDSDVNLIHCVPSVFGAITRENPRPEQFAHLRYIIMAGERIAPAAIKKWTDIFKDRIQLVNLYGATENTMAKFFYLIKQSDQNRRSIPIGKPMEGARAIILDSCAKPCDPGTSGEIYIRTPFLSLGYYRQPELTSLVFVRNPFSNDPNDIIHKTGDLGRELPDGNFELIGRKDHQVKIRGFRVELGEIETILKMHPDVGEVAAVINGKESEDQRLIAYFAPRSHATPAAGDLRRFMSENLPDHMVPSLFIKVDEMPLTRTGKVDRNALPEPDQTRPQLEEEFVAPRNPVEERLAAIWTQILQLESVGVHDNFFQLGGHSLMATQVMSRVRQAFQVEVPLRTIFEYPTLAGFAAAVQRSQAEQSQGEEARLMALVEQLSDDEADSMLNQFPASGSSEVLEQWAENA